MKRFITLDPRNNKGQFLRVSLEKCFWRHVKKTSKCWIWTGWRVKSGYGQFSRQKIAAHRFSWELRHGKITNNLHVLHKCDNPSCVRPSHLFLGTQADNNKDMWKKGRGCLPHGKGEKNNAAKLTANEVLKIRKWHRAKTYSLAEMGRKFSVHISTIWLIVHNKKWSWLCVG